MKKAIIIAIAAILLLASAGLALYPTLSEAINNYYAKSAVKEFNEQVLSMSDEERQNYFDEAQTYNRQLSYAVSDAFTNSYSLKSFLSNSNYEKLLSMNNDGQMGSVNIPKIDCCLPIYHGTSEKVLEKGAVHLATTSLPIGGEGNHAVISAHTAYPGKEFFNRLTELEIGDIFYLEIFGKPLYYKVSEINIVLPDDSDLLETQAGKDLVTLVTCTPYSVNTHRLLVTGERFYPPESTADEATADELKVINQEPSIPTVLIIAQVCIAVLAVGICILIVVLIVKSRKKKHEA